MKLLNTDPMYPVKLHDYLKDPKDIYYRGRIELASKPSIAIVGSRKCSSYGKNIAEKIAETAATYGVVVVSGMARGIDGAAHRGAIKAGGETIAVLGTGTDIIYPASNRDIYEKIVTDHLVLSEYADGTEGHSFNFPVRNRLISALSDAVVVVESGSRGGSLITAESAIEQGKEVYAVPGNINSIFSLGTNKLILDGARPLIYIDQVFKEMGYTAKYSTNLPKMGELEMSLFTEVRKYGEISVSQLCEKLGMSPREINPIISILEIKGVVYCEMGKVMVANFS